MKRYTPLLSAIVLALGLITAAQAQVSVICMGTESGGGGIRLYHYDVSSAGNPFTELEVGTCDGNILNYTNWVLPPSWSVLMTTGAKHDHWTGKTAHGQVSPGPNGKCPFFLTFTGPQITAGTFAYDNKRHSHDVGWLVGALNPATEDWSKPVGTGEGPIHAPIPEPGSLLALGSGLVALAGSILRKRR